MRMTNKTLVLKTNWMAKTKMTIMTMVLMMCKRTKMMIMMVLMMCKSTKMMMWSPCDSACVKFPAFDRVDGSLPGVGARG